MWLLAHAQAQAQVIGVNYSCRLATTILAGSRQVNQRPVRQAVGPEMYLFA